MNNGKLTKHRAWILVKAYPQPSKQYGETVCVAGISEDGQSFLRLYPIRFRRLPEEQRFSRFDLIEFDGFRPSDDHRPESWRVNEDSIRVVQRVDKTSPQSRVRLWLPHARESLEELDAERRENGASLGILRVEPESMRFHVTPFEQVSDDEQKSIRSVQSQNSLFEGEIPKLPDPEYGFSYFFRAGGNEHKMRIHDWEVQTTWLNYKKQYREDAMEKLREYYERKIPEMNPHFLMGTLNSRPHQFIVIGVLRTSENLDVIDRQPSLL